MTASRIVLAPIVLGLAAGCLALALPCVTLAGTTDGDEVTVAASPAAKLPTKADLAKSDAQAKSGATATPASTKDQVIARLAAAPRIDRTDYSRADAATSSGYESNGRTIHGVAEVSVGTGGYRSAYVSSEIPIGENGTLGIAFSQTDFGKNSPYVYGYGDDYPYGYGYGYTRGGYGGVRGRNTSTSVGLSLDMSDHDANRSDTPEGCAPGFRDGDRYIEPVWVKHTPGGPGCRAAADQP